MLSKLLPLIIPFIIYIFIKLVRTHISNILFSQHKDKNEKILSCEVCGTYVHESLVIKKYGDGYCSKECSNS